MRKMSGSVCVAVAGVCMAVACGAAVPPVPSKGGPAWTELTSEHFTVWTDAPPEQARDLVRAMEHLRQVVVGVAFPSVPAGGRMLVIALRDDDELTEFSRTHQPRAYAVPASAPVWQPVIVLSAFSNLGRGDLTPAHELTHAISFAVIHHQPRWLSEGMAQFFETVALGGNGPTVDVGVAPNWRGQPQRMAHLVPVTRLFQWQDTSKHEASEYSTAWALFTFLMNRDRAGLLRYLQILQREARSRSATSQAEAEAWWAEAFPSLPLGEVDLELRQWLLSGNHTVMHFTVEERRWPIAERALGDADAYAARAMLRFRIAQNDQARADAAAALAAEPTNVLARLVLTINGKQRPTIEEARAMVAAHPGDWRAWLLDALVISDAHGDAAEQEAARTRSCALAAHNPALVVPSGLCPADAARRESR